MKKIITSKIFIFILGAVIFGGLGVYASATYLASQITYKDTTVDAALNDLYTKTQVAGKKVCKFISGTYGQAGKVGAKYECDPGDGTKRNFYILTVRENSIDLIMDRNITQGSSNPKMTWNDAMSYFRTGAGKNIPSAWKNVLDVNLPSAQPIADAVDNKSWLASSSSQTWWCFESKSKDDANKCKSNKGTYAWLYSYLSDCADYKCETGTSLGNTEALGYWTRDLVVTSYSNSNVVFGWRISNSGAFSNPSISYTNDGVRPVITILKSNLYS